MNEHEKSMAAEFIGKKVERYTIIHIAASPNGIPYITMETAGRVAIESFGLRGKVGMFKYLEKHTGHKVL